MNSVGKTAQQTDDWQQNEDDVLRQSRRLECSVPRYTMKQFQTATHKHTELMLDALRCIKPVKLRMYQLLQTAVELPGTSNHTSCRVQHSLQLVSDSLWSPSENDVAVVDSRHHKDVERES